MLSIKSIKLNPLLMLFGLSTFGSALGQATELAVDLKLKIDSLIENNNFNGIVLITKDSNTLYSKSVGYSDFENKIPINANDQFVIGSISKQITAVLVLREIEKGKLKLSDKIRKYLKEIKQPWTKKVTIHHLLTHTHGIVDIDKPLRFKPSSQFQYSQLGYELLAQILTKVSGKTFVTLSTELFEEYGLKNTFHPHNKTYKNLVNGYEEDANGKLIFCQNSLQNYPAAGSFISNASDMRKWNDLLHSGMLVKPETLKLMKTRYATRVHPIYGTVEYGYGLLFYKDEENLQIGALGYAPGFVSASYYHPKTNINLIVFENTARNLNDFKETFRVHTELMKMVKVLL